MQFFNSRQCRDVVDCPASFHHMYKLCIFAFMYREVRLLLSEIEPRGRVDQPGFLPMFSEK